MRSVICILLAVTLIAACFAVPVLAATRGQATSGSDSSDEEHENVQPEGNQLNLRSILTVIGIVAILFAAAVIIGKIRPNGLRF